MNFQNQYIQMHVHIDIYHTIQDIVQLVNNLGKGSHDNTI